MLKYRKKYQKRLTANRERLTAQLQNLANKDPHMPAEEFHTLVYEKHKVLLTDEYVDYLFGRRDVKPGTCFRA